MREEDAKARLYYLQEAKAQNWSVRQLQRQIETRSYQRLLSTQDAVSAPETLPVTPSIRDFIKDPYILEFLGLPEDPAASETEVESVIIDLKTTKLTHQDIGQIDMYVRMFDDLKRGPDDDPSRSDPSQRSRRSGPMRFRSKFPESGFTTHLHT